jgi:hypothetical protein
MSHHHYFPLCGRPWAPVIPRCVETELFTGIQESGNIRADFHFWRRSPLGTLGIRVPYLTADSRVVMTAATECPTSRFNARTSELVEGAFWPPAAEAVTR